MDGADRVYINDGEAVIYRDGKIFAIERVSHLDEEFFKTIKLLFPESQIHILTHENTDKGYAPVEHKEEVGL